MLPVTQHLTATKEFLDIEDRKRSELIISQFIEGCKKLDAGIIEKVVDEDDIFENKSKYKFLTDIKELFDSFKFKKSGQLNVAVTDNHCQGCSFGKPIKIFSVYEIERINPMREFAFVIIEENGILKDIYQCNLFR